jgi:hypothetical protein
VTRDERVMVFRARLAGRESLAHEIEMQAGWAELATPEPVARAVESDAGKGGSIADLPPKPGSTMSLPDLASAARALWRD